MSNGIVGRWDKNVLRNLKEEFPERTSTELSRILHQDHIEMKELKIVLKKGGSFVYGKKAWEKRFGKK